MNEVRFDCDVLIPETIVHGFNWEDPLEMGDVDNLQPLRLRIDTIEGAGRSQSQVKLGLMDRFSRMA